MNGETEKNGAGLDAALEEVSRLAEEGEPESALQLLLELEPDHPTNPTLLCMIGVVADHLGAEGMAADFFRRCLAEEPTDPEILVRAGAGLAGSGDPAAEPALRLAALTAPEFAAARLHYGAFLIRSGLLNEGIDELKKAVELDSEDAEAHRELGIGYHLTGRQEQAIAEVERAVELDQEDAESRVLLALLLLARPDDVPRAAEQLHAAVSATEEDPEVQLLAALAFGLAGWMDEAWLAVSRAETALEPGDPVLVREVEEALEEGEAAIRSLLLDDMAPTALRARIHRIR